MLVEGRRNDVTGSSLAGAEALRCIIVRYLYQKINKKSGRI